MSTEAYRQAIAVAEFPGSGLASIALAGWKVLITRQGEEFHALNDRCPHAASPLSTGRLRRGIIMCPLHGARFDVASGKCIGGEYRAVRHFPVRVVDGWVEVAVPSQPPGLSERPLD